MPADSTYDLKIDLFNFLAFLILHLTGNFGHFLLDNFLACDILIKAPQPYIGLILPQTKFGAR